MVRSRSKGFDGGGRGDAMGFGFCADGREQKMLIVYDAEEEGAKLEFSLSLLKTQVRGFVSFLLSEVAL